VGIKNKIKKKNSLIFIFDFVSKFLFFGQNFFNLISFSIFWTKNFLI